MPENPTFLREAVLRNLAFALDPHLKPLARWLRWLGYDAILFKHSPRSLQEARRIKGRIYLTTSRTGFSLAIKALRPALLLPLRGSTEEQLRTVLLLLEITPTLRFDRCSVCNAPLEWVEKEEIKCTIPERVSEEGMEFRRCPRCRRIYWEGDHVERIRTIYQRVCGTNPTPSQDMP